MWNKVKRSLLLEIHARDNLASLPEFFVQLYPAADFLEQAFQLAFRLRHPVYDCLYLALAMREQAQLITADRDFHRAIAKYGEYEGARLLEW